MNNDERIALESQTFDFGIFGENPCPENELAVFWWDVRDFVFHICNGGTDRDVNFVLDPDNGANIDFDAHGKMLAWQSIKRLDFGEEKEGEYEIIFTNSDKKRWFENNVMEERYRHTCSSGVKRRI